MHEVRRRLEALIDEHRVALRSSLDGLTEQEARARLVPSRTTLLGLVRHVTYVEGIWFDQAITGRSPAEIGIAATPHASFALRRNDTIASVQAAHAAACESSRRRVAALDDGALLTGRRPQTLWDVQTHVLRELAQHCGHADVLREQVLAAREDG